LKKPLFAMTIRIRAAIALLTLGPLLAAQPTYTTLETTTSKAQKAYKEGRAAMQDGDVAGAIRHYTRAAEIDPRLVEAQLYLGGAHLESAHWAEAEICFEKALALAPDFEQGRALFPLAEAEWQQDKFGECATHAEAYAARPGTPEKARRTAARLAENARFSAIAVQNPVHFVPRSLGPGVNSAASEYLPARTADGQLLLFTRLDGGYDENFYQSRRLAADSLEWDTATPLDGINSTQNEGAESISADGSWMAFTACNRRDDGAQGSCDLYWSQFKNEAWTKPVPFSATINSSAWDAQPSISADGNSLFFSSERPGGVGRRDLWVSTRPPGGKWAAPTCLGPTINTPGDEQTPFIHPDGQTLYFTSDGLPGMGQNDIYFSRRQADGTWGRPENLGYPINTKAHEGTLSVSLDGATAYFAAERPGGMGKLDIYEFEMPAAARPRAVTYARIRVSDGNTLQPMVGRVEITDLATGQLTMIANARQNGGALVCLPAGGRYALTVSRDKYLFHTENFDLTEVATFERPFELNVSLWPAVAPAERPDSVAHPVVLRNVFFASGSAELRPESKPELDVLVRFLNENPTLRIQINGHTDDVGDDATNLTLSENRANSVRNYLITNKIAAERLRARGFGEQQPVQPNDSDAHRAANRRTEFVTW
jgi:outer membrane protein OmpA-like peptidoglycan-associated protein